MKWSDKCNLFVGSEANQEPELKITDTKLYAPVVTLSTQYNKNCLSNLEPFSKKTINWNKY